MAVNIKALTERKASLIKSRDALIAKETALNAKIALGGAPVGYWAKYNANIAKLENQASAISTKVETLNVNERATIEAKFAATVDEIELAKVAVQDKRTELNAEISQLTAMITAHAAAPTEFSPADPNPTFMGVPTGKKGK